MGTTKAKVKVRCPSPCGGGTRGGKRYTCAHSTQHYMEVSDHLHSPNALTLEKEPPVPIQDDAGHQSGRFGEEKKKNHQTCWKSNHGSFSPWVSNPRTARLYYAARGHICKFCGGINVTLRHVHTTIVAVEKR
jgi:hypothetical protein